MDLLVTGAFPQLPRKLEALSWGINDQSNSYSGIFHRFLTQVEILNKFSLCVHQVSLRDEWFLVEFMRNIKADHLKISTFQFTLETELSIFRDKFLKEVVHFIIQTRPSEVSLSFMLHFESDFDMIAPLFQDLIYAGCNIRHILLYSNYGFTSHGLETIYSEMSKIKDLKVLTWDYV